MNPEVINYWNVAKEIIKDVAIYVMPIAAFIVSLIALKRSNDTMKVQVQLSEVEQKLNEYELALKKYELEKIKEKEEKRAYIEARVINIAKGKYKLKVWNSGNSTAYNIKAYIPEEYNIVVIGDKMPYEYLEPGNGFDQHVLMHGGSSSKFKIICTWEDEQGKIEQNEQLRDW